MREKKNNSEGRIGKLLCASAVLLTIFLIVCVLMILGSGDDRYKNTEEPDIVTTYLTGQISILRRGAGYRLKEGIALTEADSITTRSDARAVFTAKGCGVFIMDENSEAVVEEVSEEQISISSKYGTLFFEAKDSAKTYVINSPAGSLCAGEGSILSVETYYGTQTFRVYKGSAELSSETLEEKLCLSSGSQVIVYQDDEGVCSYDDPISIPIQSMGSFLIDMLTESENQETFPQEQLKVEVERREQEVEKAKAERKKYEDEIIAQGGTVPVIVSTKPLAEYMTEADLHTCMITIVCDTILDNMDSLRQGKNVYVPANGVLLASSTVQYVEGETVFDVLKRACAAAGIPIEYSWTVEYGGYYIEGINNLYEFDCGPESGWAYKVNGWFPNYGCSNYILKDGDIIVWAYTCHGLGADIGANWPL